MRQCDVCLSERNLVSLNLKKHYPTHRVISVCVLPATRPSLKASLLAWDGGHQPLESSEKWAPAGSGKPWKEWERERNEYESLLSGCLAHGSQFGILSGNSKAQMHTTGSPKCPCSSSFLLVFSIYSFIFNLLHFILLHFIIFLLFYVIVTSLLFSSLMIFRASGFSRPGEW